ncbi:MAG TPA: STAS domain-containing protein [Nevskiaceae bacterium]|nr:STAS domain-containing protein [Nevskiaceae bacterium]
MSAAGTPSGELSFATARGLLEALGGADSIDLTAISRADSAGISLLLELTRRAQARSRTLTLHNANAQVRSLARFFGVDSLLEFR